MKKPDKAPIDLDEERQAEIRDMKAESARAWAKLSPRLRAIAAEAMRKGFAGPYDDPDDGPVAA